MNDTDELSGRSWTPEGDSGLVFERDVLPLAGDLHRRALGYTKNAADAEDLVQETLLKAYKAFGRLRDDTHLRAWLLCIMRNTWINDYRATQRRPVEVLTEDIANGQLEPGAAHTPSAEHQALHHVMDSGLISALLTLSEDMRATVYYVAIRGMSCREVAEIMSVPEGTVLSRMHRSRIKLRRSLDMNTHSARRHAA